MKCSLCDKPLVSSLSDNIYYCNKCFIFSEGIEGTCCCEHIIADKMKFVLSMAEISSPNEVLYILKIIYVSILNLNNKSEKMLELEYLLSDAIFMDDIDLTIDRISKMKL